MESKSYVRHPFGESPIGQQMSAFEDDVEPLNEPYQTDSPLASGSQSRNRGAAASTTRPLSPEPDEDLDTTDGNHSMWLVKVPRFLLEGWSKVDEDDRRLGTVRVYDPDHKGRQRMELLLPEAPEAAIPLPPSHPYLQTNYPRRYDLRITSEQGSDRVRNLYAFKEKLQGGDDNDDEDFDSGLEDEKGKGRSSSAAAYGGGSKGRRVVAMVGTITNEAALKPQVTPAVMRTGNASHGVGLTPEYREVLRKRRLEASKPRASVKVLDESDRARTNMLSAGVSAHTNKASKAALIANTTTTNAAQRKHQQSERFARMPRNELLDILFELFDQFPYWSMKGLRGRVQQPEAYLREVLVSIADLHKRGPYSGNWSLKPDFVEMRKQQDRANTMAASALAGGSGVPASTTAKPSAPAPGNDVDSNSKKPGADDGEEEDENDFDMEDVA